MPEPDDPLPALPSANGAPQAAVAIARKMLKSVIFTLRSVRLI